jgi:hypothetical protein
MALYCCHGDIMVFINNELIMVEIGEIVTSKY